MRLDNWYEGASMHETIGLSGTWGLCILGTRKSGQEPDGLILWYIFLGSFCLLCSFNSVRYNLASCVGVGSLESFL